MKLSSFTKGVASLDKYTNALWRRGEEYANRKYGRAVLSERPTGILDIIDVDYARSAHWWIGYRELLEGDGLGPDACDFMFGRLARPFKPTVRPCARNGHVEFQADCVAG
ncbi:MAG: hypothetical protein AAAB35_19145 [Phyllobacterium sp.]|jgi:hypothetical protein|uniref:hypothetical protein n=1 Tax=Phyllobacterium sp. TaxID=1871046 RepID=UPI000DDBDBCA